MIELRPIRIEELRLLAQSHDAFREFMGLEVIEGGVLPSEFVAQFLPNAEGNAPWLGVWAVVDGAIAGSGMCKTRPLNGTVEIGYGVAPSVEGRGVATEIAKGLVKMAFDLGAQSVIAHTLPDGYASQRVLAKAGFQHEGQVIDPEDGLVERFRVTRPD